MLLPPPPQTIPSCCFPRSSPKRNSRDSSRCWNPDTGQRRLPCGQRNQMANQTKTQKKKLKKKKPRCPLQCLQWISTHVRVSGLPDRPTVRRQSQINRSIDRSLVKKSIGELRSSERVWFYKSEFTSSTFELGLAIPVAWVGLCEFGKQSDKKLAFAYPLLLLRRRTMSQLHRSMLRSSRFRLLRRRVAL